MVIKETDVYQWFKEQSGAKRVEVLSTLLHNCIPLEWRFFATLVESLCRRDFLALNRDENESNSPTHMTQLCDRDWLEGVEPIVRPVAVEPPIESNALEEQEPKQSIPEPLALTSRSNVVVNLCLLYSTNRVCATIVFNAISKHLSLEAIRSRLESCYSSKFSHNNNDTNTSDNNNMTNKLVPPPGYAMSMPDPQFVAQVTLVYTMALFHPAFSFEQKACLSQEFVRLNAYLDYLNSRIQGVYGVGSYCPPSVYPLSSPSVKSAPVYCYNCGEENHRGNECPEPTLDEHMKSSEFNLNLQPEPMVISVNSPAVTSIIVPSPLPVTTIPLIHSPLVVTNNQPPISQLRRPSASIKVDMSPSGMHQSSTTSSASSDISSGLS